MSAKQLGFASSWRMMTRDKGWLKPVMVLTLVGLIPIVGQMAILGYGYEWARLTAWGVDAAPKQRNVDYGKVMTTGAKAFALALLMNMALGVLSALIPVLGVGTAGVLSLFSPFASVSLLASGMVLSAVALLVVGTLANTFISVCALRMTIYDRFGAGWRLDRVFQMIGRDFGGFVHAFAVSLLANLLPFAFAVLAAVLGGLVLGVGAAGFGYGYTYYGWAISTAMVLVLAAVVVVVLAVFAYGCLSVVAQLVSINAVGQWVQRFDVARWGTSADPLPTDVPHRDNGPSAGGAPLPPSTGHVAESAPQQTAWQEPQPPANAAPVAEPAAAAAETSVIASDEAVTQAVPATPTEVLGEKGAEPPAEVPVDNAGADAQVPTAPVVSDADGADEDFGDPEAAAPDQAPTTVLPVADEGTADDPDLILPDASANGDAPASKED